MRWWAFSPLPPPAGPALWHHFVTGSSTSCNLTLTDRIMSASGLPGLLPDVFEARATCADAAVRLFGVPYQLWSLALFVTLAAAAVGLLARRS
jgi:disulfide bond formation protein DsbB